MPTARNNEDSLKGNGGKRSKKGVNDNLSSSNETVKRKRKVDPAGLGGPSTVKIVTADTSGVGGEKSSKQFRDTKVKSSSGKSSRDSGKNSVGTLEQAIRERNIFTAFAKMPAETQMTLIKNGWIGKITSNDNCGFGRSDATVEVISLHNNEERVKGVAKRYESGLMWMDAHSGGVDWMTLRPDVVVNRFPRDANASLKLCGHALAGRSEFDGHYPRTYPARTEGIHADSFVADYSLTACVSLLRAFVDGGHQNMCAKNGQVPLSALNFAAFKCHQYLTDDGSLFPVSFLGKGGAWETFFQHYYKIVHDQRKFTVPVDDEEAALRFLTASSALLVHQLTEARPQTAIDGYQNVWIVKSTAALHGGRPVMSNKIDDLMDSIGRSGGSDRVVQKYIETPLLRDNVKSDVHTWIVLSTLDGRLTVWLHRTCAVQPYAHRFSLHREAAVSGHIDRAKSHGLHAILRPTALTCGLDQLASTMRRNETTGEQRKRLRNRQRRRSAVEGGGNDDEIYSAIRRSVVSAMTAAATAGSLDLRPNCFELFRGTFVLGDDTRPWLIDIVSDDPCLDADCRHSDRTAPAAVVARSVARGVAKILVRSGRGRATRIGMFDVVHECPMPAGAVSYAPRPYAESARASTASKLLVNRKIDRQRGHASQSVPPVTRHQRHWWDDNSISTYVQTVTADDVLLEQPRTSTPAIGVQAVVDDAELSSEVIAASTENIADLCVPLESRSRLPLSERCKTKFSSVQKICKFIMRRGLKKNKRNSR
ncbi:protein monoglycylase TTLL8-like [Rhopalosiphum maidis]|uniref:protein monoglycylase TTLL8-like n=1 Tax=Rhopalosiphum maidis TaxID=43146 RepID=UPI000EFF233A|nr:protein monoglycylase TTLL8-like [Rhopalosiphum maidis]